MEHATTTDGVATPAAGCPVDHGAMTAAAPVDQPVAAEPVASAPPARRPAMPATALPGPRMHVLRQIRKYWKHQYAFMAENRRLYGPRFTLTVRIPPAPIYILSDPDDLKELFTAPPDVIHTGLGSSMLEKFTGQTGLAWLDEDEHKSRRKVLMPSMHGKAFRRIESNIDGIAELELAKWPIGRPFSLHPRVQIITLNVIREVIFGAKVPARWNELLEVLNGMLDFNDKFASTIMIHRMSPRAVKVLRAIRPLGMDKFLRLRERADALLAEAVRERLDSGVAGDDMLGVLLASKDRNGEPLGGTELRDEMMTIFLAGNETTTSGIARGLEILSREREVHDRLRAEIDAGESDAYLTATVYEILRMHSPLPQVIAREVMKPIEIGGVQYQPGDILAPSAYLLHNDPAYYPEPERFQPERFLDVKPNMYTWIPFGGGRTRCLGDKIGIAEMKSVLRKVVSQFDLVRESPEPEGTRSRLILSVPEKGGRIALRPRARAASLTGA
ncbi:cytochrome P450 [Solwaraspora sp. WMMB335]|uniref:cytochrome P450 n=1 Tax=Solwaraspora sp. WMMB335 TaxID=3404118 RepID=UPI003B95E7C6